MFKHCGNHVRSPKFENLGREPAWAVMIRTNIYFLFLSVYKGRLRLVWGKEGEHLVYQDETSHRE